jgi:hypothetical protein
MRQLTVPQVEERRNKNAQAAIETEAFDSESTGIYFYSALEFITVRGFD